MERRQRSLVFVYQIGMVGLNPARLGLVLPEVREGIHRFGDAVRFGHCSIVGASYCSVS